MATMSHEPARATVDRPRLSQQLLVPEMWASLAIAVMWLSVLFTAIYGPDIESRSVAGGVAGDTTVVPSAVVVALFAFFATWVVARYGFKARERE